MKIVADAELFHVVEVFGDLGELTLLPGREIETSHLVHADALIIRSVTNVSAELLKNSAVRFVGTATSGVDHIDTDFLAEAGIQLVDAKGTNANAVVDYCFAAFGELGYLQEKTFDSLEVGIVGYGAIGSLLAKKLRALGAIIKISDPLVQKAFSKGVGADFTFSDLDELIECDIISIHTPLISKGEHPTMNLIQGDFLSQMKKNALLINTSRGGVVDERAILRSVEKGQEIRLVIDVWENEPLVSEDLVAVADLASPHIAGYSQESKYAAVTFLRKAFIDFFKLDVVVKPLNKIYDPITELDIKKASIKNILEQSFSINKLSADFKKAAEKNRIEDYFDRARKNLHTRKEYSSLSISCFENDGFVGNVLNQLGVNIH